MKRIILMLTVAAFMVAALTVSAAAAFAAPITCSGGQTVTKTSDGWTCVNNGGNDTGSGKHQGNGDKFGKTFP
jgi:hypothetical protein